MHRVHDIRQDSPSQHKLWFNDGACDLFVWLDRDGQISRFQFCYGKPTDEHVAEWATNEGFRHMRVDDGEVGGLAHGMTPIFVPDGAFDPEAMTRTLEDHSQEVPADIVRFVRARLLEADVVAA